MNDSARKTITACTITALLLAAPTGRAGSVATGPASELTQILNNVQLVHQYAQQVQQYATQLQQYQNMITNTINIPAQVWGQVQADLNGIANVARQGQALAYSMANIDTQFKATFKGYHVPVNYAAQYQSWSRTTLDSLKNALEAAGLQSQQFATEEGVLAQLRVMSQGASGQMQAIQVGSQIAEQQVQQLQKLRQLMMLQLQSQNTYLAAQESKDSAVKAARDDAVNYRDPTRPYTQFKGGSK